VPEAKLMVAAMAVVLAGGLAACGNDTPSSSSSASKADFCRTFDRLGSDTSPEHAADELSRVGTPSDIGSSARRGFDVLLDDLRNLPPGAKPGEITQMVKDLPAQDATDVRDFITYYGAECQGLPGDRAS
jgi:hypothetical protein